MIKGFKMPDGSVDLYDFGSLDNKPDMDQYAKKTDLPTKVSDLTDDSGHYMKPATGIPASDLADGIVVVTDQVSGASPTITAQANHRYICGEVTSISITPCASGICDVVFTSGSTVTVLTLPSTVKMPEWWDGTCEANTVYEINVMDGIYGTVMAWTA